MMSGEADKVHDSMHSHGSIDTTDINGVVDTHDGHVSHSTIDKHQRPEIRNNQSPIFQPLPDTEQHYRIPYAGDFQRFAFRENYGLNDTRQNHNSTNIRAKLCTSETTDILIQSFAEDNQVFTDNCHNRTFPDVQDTLLYIHPEDNDNPHVGKDINGIHDTTDLEEKPHVYGQPSEECDVYADKNCACEHKKFMGPPTINHMAIAEQRMEEKKLSKMHETSSMASAFKALGVDVNMSAYLEDQWKPESIQTPYSAIADQDHLESESITKPYSTKENKGTLPKPPSDESEYASDNNNDILRLIFKKLEDIQSSVLGVSQEQIALKQMFIKQEINSQTYRNSTGQINNRQPNDRSASDSAELSLNLLEDSSFYLQPCTFDEGPEETQLNIHPTFDLVSDEDNACITTSCSPPGYLYLDGFSDTVSYMSAPQYLYNTPARKRLDLPSLHLSYDDMLSDDSSFCSSSLQDTDDSSECNLDVYGQIRAGRPMSRVSHSKEHSLISSPSLFESSDGQEPNRSFLRSSPLTNDNIRNDIDKDSHRGGLDPMAHIIQDRKGHTPAIPSLSDFFTADVEFDKHSQTLYNIECNNHEEVDCCHITYSDQKSSNRLLRDSSFEYKSTFAGSNSSFFSCGYGRGETYAHRDASNSSFLSTGDRNMHERIEVPNRCEKDQLSIGQEMCEECPLMENALKAMVCQLPAYTIAMKSATIHQVDEQAVTTEMVNEADDNPSYCTIYPKPVVPLACDTIDIKNVKEIIHIDSGSSTKELVCYGKRNDNAYTAHIERKGLDGKTQSVDKVHCKEFETVDSRKCDCNMSKEESHIEGLLNRDISFYWEKSCPIQKTPGNTVTDTILTNKFDYTKSKCLEEEDIIDHNVTANYTNADTNTHENDRSLAELVSQVTMEEIGLNSAEFNSASVNEKCLPYYTESLKTNIEEEETVEAMSETNERIDKLVELSCLPADEKKFELDNISNQINRLQYKELSRDSGLPDSGPQYSLPISSSMSLSNQLVKETTDTTDSAGKKILTSLGDIHTLEQGAEDVHPTCHLTTVHTGSVENCSHAPIKTYDDGFESTSEKNDSFSHRRIQRDCGRCKGMPVYTDDNRRYTGKKIQNDYGNTTPKRVDSKATNLQACFHTNTNSYQLIPHSIPLLLPSSKVQIIKAAGFGEKQICNKFTSLKSIYKGEACDVITFYGDLQTSQDRYVQETVMGKIRSTAILPLLAHGVAQHCERVILYPEMATLRRFNEGKSHTEETNSKILRGCLTLCFRLLSNEQITRSPYKFKAFSIDDVFVDADLNMRVKMSAISAITTAPLQNVFSDIKSCIRYSVAKVVRDIRSKLSSDDEHFNSTTPIGLRDMIKYLLEENVADEMFLEKLKLFLEEHGCGVYSNGEKCECCLGDVIGEEFTYALLVEGSDSDGYQHLLQSDIKMMAETMINTNGMAIPPANVWHVGPREHDTKDKLFEQIGKLKDIFSGYKSPRGRIYLYLTGHGAKHGDSVCFCFSSGADSILQASELRTAFSEINAEELVVIADFCHAGGYKILPNKPGNTQGKFKSAVHMASCYPAEKAKFGETCSNYTYAICKGLNGGRECPKDIENCSICFKFQTSSQNSGTIQASNLQDFCLKHSEEGVTPLLSGHYNSDLKLGRWPCLYPCDHVDFKDVWGQTVRVMEIPHNLGNLAPFMETLAVAENDIFPHLRGASFRLYWNDNLEDVKDVSELRGSFSSHLCYGPEMEIRKLRHDHVFPVAILEVDTLAALRCLQNIISETVCCFKWIENDIGMSHNFNYRLCHLDVPRLLALMPVESRLLGIEDIVADPTRMFFIQALWKFMHVIHNNNINTDLIIKIFKDVALFMQDTHVSHSAGK